VLDTGCWIRKKIGCPTQYSEISPVQFPDRPATCPLVPCMAGGLLSRRRDRREGLRKMRFMNEGFRYCKSWEGGLFLTSEVIFASVFVLVFLSESVTWRFWVGGILIFTSVIVLNLGSTRRQPDLAESGGSKDRRKVK
jgi:hypothetical protein